MPMLTPRVQAFRLLNAIFEEAKHDFRLPVNYHEAARKHGMTREEAIPAKNYLARMQLIEEKTMPDGVLITPMGMREVEDALERPDKPTQHFPPANVLNVQYMYGSQVQLGTQGSSQTMQISGDAVQQIKEVIAAIERDMKALGLDEVKRAELQAEVDTMKPQLAKQSPSRSILGEALKTTRTILEGGAANAVSAPIIAKVTAVLHMLGFGV